MLRIVAATRGVPGRRAYLTFSGEVSYVEAEQSVGESGRYAAAATS